MDSLALELAVCCAYVETGIRPPLNSDRSTLVAKGRVIRPSHSWFNADFVVHRKPELLFTAEVMFRLNGYVAEKELDLVELAARQMAKTCTCPSQIVRRQFVYARGLGRFLDDFPKHLRRHALAPDPS